MVRYVLLVFIVVQLACGEKERHAFTTWDNATDFLKSQICADSPIIFEPEPFHIAGFKCSLRRVYAEGNPTCSVSIAIRENLSSVTDVSFQCLRLTEPISARLLADLALAMRIDIPPAELLALTADPDPDVELTLVWQHSDVQLQFVRTWDPDLNTGDATAEVAFVRKGETINRRDVGPHRFGTVSAKYLKLKQEISPATPTP